MNRTAGAASAALLAPTLVALLTAAAPAQKPKAGEPKGADAKAATPVVAGEAGAALDRIVVAFDKEGGGFCGCVLVALKGEVLLEKGYGTADAAAKLPM